MAQYAVDIWRAPTKVIDGVWRKVFKARVSRYDKPTGRPVKVGTTEVLAWSKHDGHRLAAEAARDLIRRDQAARKREINGKIERSTSAQKRAIERKIVSLTKG